MLNRNPIPADAKKLFMPKYPCVDAMCENCPFRADGNGYARDHPDFPKIVQSVELGMPFFCHETVIKDERTTLTFDPLVGEEVPDPSVQPHFRSCLGAVKYKRGEITLKSVRKKRPYRPTPMMKLVVENISEGLGTHYNCRGQSEYGGRSRILTALIQNGFLTRDYELTDKGKILAAQ